MKNITNKTKTILFASLIAAMILPFSGMDFAEAKTDNGAEKIAKYNQKLEQFRQQALRDGDVPDSELLDRLGDKWTSQYTNVDEFERTQKGMKSYVNGIYQNNGWNQALVKEHIKIQNFETIIGNIGNGHEIVSLVVEKNKIQGKYDPSEPVKKFHEWISTQYSTPNTVQEIDERLLKIVGEQKFVNLAKKVAKHFDNMAEHGSVPTKLMNLDADYWITVANRSMCGYNPDCNVGELENPQNLEDVTPVSTGIWEYVLPEAAAVTQVTYTLSTYVTASGCYYNDCYRSYVAYPNGSGVIDVSSFLTTNPDPPYNVYVQHTAPGKTVTVHASACGWYPGQTVSNQVTVTPYLGLVLRPSVSDSDTNTGGCAIAHSSFPVTKDWIYGVKAESTGSYY